MSLSRSSSVPPSAMTWGKALPVVLLAGTFDTVRGFFIFFWLLGPALVAGACAYQFSGSVVSEYAAAGCAAGAVIGVTAANFFTGGGFSAALVGFGEIMAKVVALIGWLSIALILLLSNARIFKVNASAWLTSLAGFGVAMLPLLGFLPALTGTTIRMYHVQIKKEKENLAIWHKKNDERIRAEREQQEAMMLEEQLQAEEEEMELVRAQEEDTAVAEEEERDLDEKLAQAESEEEIPEHERLAA